VSAARNVTIWFAGKRREVTAHPTPVPGLVIHASVGRHDEGTWTVTHEASGSGIFLLPEPEAARNAAVLLGELADWRQPGSALRDTAGLDVRVRCVARRLGCYSLTYSGRTFITDRELAITEAPRKEPIQ